MISNHVSEDIPSSIFSVVQREQLPYRWKRNAPQKRW